MTTLPANAEEARAAISAATQAGDADAVELLRCVLLLDDKGMLDWSPVPQEEDPAPTVAPPQPQTRPAVRAAPDMVSLLDPESADPDLDSGTADGAVPATESGREESAADGPVALPVVCVVGDAAEVPDGARQWTRDQLGRVLTRLREVHQTTCAVSTPGEVGEWAQDAAANCRLEPAPASPATHGYDAAVVVWDGRLVGRAYRTVVATMADGHPVIRIDPATRVVSSRGRWES